MDPTRPQPICTLYPFIFDNYILCFPAEFAYADGPFLQLPVQLCVTWIKVNAVLHHGRQRPNANDAKTVHVYNYFRKWKFCDRTSGTRGHVRTIDQKFCGPQNFWSLQSIEYKVSDTKYPIPWHVNVSIPSKYRIQTNVGENYERAPQKRPIEKYEICDNSLKTLTFPKWRSDGGAHCLRDSNGLTQPPGSRVEKRS